MLKLFVFSLLSTFVLLGIYWQGLSGSFFFDDIPNIVLSESIRLETWDLSSVLAVLTGGAAGPFGRPVAQLSFALNYYFAGSDPFSYKLTNLAIHLFNGILVVMLAHRCLLVDGVAISRKYFLIASGLFSALWMLHPIQLLPVLHVVQRMTSLSTLFLFSALVCHIHGRESIGKKAYAWLMVGWLVLWPLSCLSKETGLLFPGFVLAWEIFIRRFSLGYIDRFAKAFSWSIVFLVVFIIGYMLSQRGGWLWAGYLLRDFSLSERLLTEGRVLWFYIGLIFFPRMEAFGLFHDDIKISTGFFDPASTLAALAGLVVLIWLIWKARLKYPVFAFGISWFLIGHLLESTVLPLEIAHEHRNYLPLFGILLAVWSILLRGFAASGPIKTLSVSLLVAALAYFPFITLLRSDQFGNEFLRSQIEAQHHRNSARAQLDAGNVMAGLVDSASAVSPAYSMAKTQYELAGQLDQNLKMNWLAMMQLNCRVGLPVEGSWVGEMQSRLKDRPFAPGDLTVLYNLKELAIAAPRCLDKATVVTLFSAAISNPDVSAAMQAILYSWQADYLWLGTSNLEAARISLGKSLALAPANSSNRLKLAQIMFLAGEGSQARDLLLQLQSLSLTATDRKLLNELLGSPNFLGSQPSQLKAEK